MTEDVIWANEARFIKLGKAGAWTETCLADGTLRLDYRHVSESLARTPDFDALRSDFEAKEITSRAATNHARQVLDFFDEDPNVLWITFHKGYLYWCFAQSDVERINAGDEAAIDAEGAWLRQTCSGWSRCSLDGQELLENELSGQLNKTASYQGTICTVKPLDYLLAKINAAPIPEIVEAQQARNQLLASTCTLMAMLTWADFEFLVGAVFEGSGWRQVRQPGGSKHTTDIDLFMPLTGERAFAQVKSRTDQGQFNAYLREFKARPETRLFYAYHTSDEPIACVDPTVTLMGAKALANQVLDAGLFNWLLTKAG